MAKLISYEALMNRHDILSPALFGGLIAVGFELSGALAVVAVFAPVAAVTLYVFLEFIVAKKQAVGRGEKDHHG